MHVFGGGIRVNTFEIALYSLKECDFLTIFHESLFPYRDVFLLGLDEHQVHVGEHLIHVVLLSQLVSLLPELALVHVEVRYKVVLLHVAWCQRTVKVVRDGHIAVFFNHFIINKL